MNNRSDLNGHLLVLIKSETFLKFKGMCALRNENDCSDVIIFESNSFKYRDMREKDQWLFHS